MTSFKSISLRLWICITDSEDNLASGIALRSGVLSLFMLVNQKGQDDDNEFNAWCNGTNFDWSIQKMVVFILEDALSVWTHLGKHLLLDGLCVSSTCIKTGTRRIMRLDELSSVVRLELRTMVDSSSRRIMRPLDKNGQCQSMSINNQCQSINVFKQRLINQK